MAKIINFFGGPASTKSTSAGIAYGFLKQKGKSAGLVQEVATELIQAERYLELKNQLYMFSETFRRLMVMETKLDYIIMDSPLLLNAVYAKWNNDKMILDAGFNNLVLNISNSFSNVNIYLNRDDSLYTTAGRIHTLEESKKIDNIILDILNESGQSYIKIDREELIKTLEGIINE